MANVEHGRAILLVKGLLVVAGELLKSASVSDATDISGVLFFGGAGRDLLLLGPKLLNILELARLLALNLVQHC